MLYLQAPPGSPGQCGATWVPVFHAFGTAVAFMYHYGSRGTTAVPLGCQYFTLVAPRWPGVPLRVAWYHCGATWVPVLYACDTSVALGVTRQTPSPSRSHPPRCLKRPPPRPAPRPAPRPSRACRSRVAQGQTSRPQRQSARRTRKIDFWN